MIARSRLSRIVQSLALHLGAALIIGYFAVQAYDGNYGLLARRAFEREIGELTRERAAVMAERADWGHRVGLLRPDRLDPDILEELARRDLNYAHPNDLVMLPSAR
jgi:cell division protein FtsB